jgi:nickel/cobalt transporter (NicO) family protein
VAAPDAGCAPGARAAPRPRGLRRGMAPASRPRAGAARRATTRACPGRDAGAIPRRCPLGLGAAHALSPGHGKTIMAAYLVGTRGTVKHALFLGLTVTLSHTLGVLALGGVALYASSLIAPDRLYPWLGLTSGVIILGIGVWLLVCRVRQNLEQHHHHHSSGYHHHHRPDGSNKLSLTWKNLTALGVVGGLVPSASALVILLAAISLHRLSFGLLLILAFSAGMAAVLAGVGLVLVYAGKAVERVGFQHRWIASLASRIPLMTALVVLVSGLVLAVRAALQIGLV